MLHEKIFSEIAFELKKAINKFPQWPSDSLHALAIVGEEYGEMVQAALQNIYEKEKGKNLQEVRCEAMQCAAMLVRFIDHLDNGLYRDEKRYF